jgi:MFS family permease
MIFQPLCGQMANIFGRKSLMIVSIAIFLAGSAICGASQSMSMLISGRVIQGAGAGGMNMLAHVIISDIIPLRERGSFMAIIYLAIAVGTGIGPIVGGVIVEKTTWRWVFLLNLPVGGLALLLVMAFLQVKHNKKSTVMAKLKRVDYIGNAIFIPSVVSILLALTWGGTTYPWSSWRVIFSFVIGFDGLGVFGIFEGSKYCLEPTMPHRLFTNRTTVAALNLALINSIVLFWMLYW